MASKTDVKLTEHFLMGSSPFSADGSPLLLPELEATQRRPKRDHRDKLNLAKLIGSHYQAFHDARIPPVKVWTWKKAAIEVFAVSKAFPLVRNEHAIQAMTAWFHLLCNVDDVVEKLDQVSARTSLSQSIYMIRNSCIWRQCPDTRSGSFDEKLGTQRHDSLSPPISKRSSSSSINRQDGNCAILALTECFIQQCFRVLPPDAIRKVAEAAISVWQFMSVEVDERQRLTGPTPEDYLGLRVHTIGLSPFFTIMQCLLIEGKSKTRELALTNPFATLTASINLAVGLQNDIIGLEKDIAKGEKFNLILLMATQPEEDIKDALTTAIEMHNSAVRSAMTCYDELLSGISHFADQDVELVAECMLMFLRTHYAWATRSRRYQKPKKKAGQLVADGMKMVVLEVLCYQARMVRWRNGRICC